jgi:Spy/CpxP family protein refolding chaperone
MTKAVVLISFLIAFTAGLVTGFEWRRPSAQPPSAPGRHRGSWLAAELSLTPQQQEQLSKIWSETARWGSRDHEERRRQCRKDREDAIASLIPAEDKPKYDEIMKRYSDRMGVLDAELRSSYQNAVDKTKGILTPEQRKKYETILERSGHGPGPGPREWDRGGRPDRDKGGRGYEHGRQVDGRATSRPASDRSN